MIGTFLVALLPAPHLFMQFQNPFPLGQEYPVMHFSAEPSRFFFIKTLLADLFFHPPGKLVFPDRGIRPFRQVLRLVQKSVSSPLIQ